MADSCDDHCHDNLDDAYHKNCDDHGLEDAGIMDAMAWCGLEKFVGRVLTFKEALYELIHDSV